MSNVNEYTIMESLQAFILNHMSDKFQTGSVLIDFPDPANLPKPNVIYITPESSDYEVLTSAEDLVSATYSVFIMAKGNKRTNLQGLVYSEKDTLVELLRSHQNLDDGATDTISVTGTEFFPSTASTGVVPCLTLTLVAQYVTEHD